MTIMEQMRLTQIQMDSNRSAYEKIEAVRDAIIKEYEEREANAPAQIHITSEVKTK